MPNLLHSKKDTAHASNKVCMLGMYRLPVFLLLSCSILFLCRSAGEEKKGGGGEIPFVNNSWDLGHVLNLDTNVGSF